ncbi:hypothetical protein [Candidatus Methanoperedens nitratireducens]|uniref:hypothetical protein n=1 Tax=Candidatus Methanoperedens nitratireducens TaxID=1392998 RepID=UPI00373AE32A
MKKFNIHRIIVFFIVIFECHKELESVLEGWLIVKIRHGDTLPVILSNSSPNS